MKLRYPFFVLALASLGSLQMTAQQDPMFTHYMDNTLMINPAYAGSREALTVTALQRMQWVDFKGAPVTQTITMHAPLPNEHLGLGLSVLNDKIGPSNNTSVFVDFAYIMKLSPKSKLALGVNAGASMFQANLSTLQVEQASDPLFQNNVNNQMTPNFGFGAYYYRERFYAGISVPNLMQNNYSVVNEANGTSKLGLEQRHYYLIAGTVIRMSDNLEFKPTTLVKVTPGAPSEIDLTGTFIVMKKLLLGVMFRSGDAFGGLVGLNVTEQLHLGYSYDWSYGLSSSKYNQGSHEIVLRYDFLFYNKKQIHSPRYF
ncbi:MAG: type IX secretion system membrane protein PorP/SprF [Bacteroidia bacterium]